MNGDCHIHIFMNGYDYKKAVADHEHEPNESLIRQYLQTYKEMGITFLRDGGDRFGVSELAKKIAPEYDIDYRTPIFAIYKEGHYGSIVGRGFTSRQEYQGLVFEAKNRGADFIKIMTTGIMDFDTDGHITGQALSKEEVRQMVEIAHEAGLAVMTHTNGSQSVQEAVQAGADSIEHGNYIDDETLQILAESSAVLVPTLVTVANLYQEGRFHDQVIKNILDNGKNRIKKAYDMGVKMALGSDAGAYHVPHGQGISQEYNLFAEILSGEKDFALCLGDGERIIKQKFCR